MMLYATEADIKRFMSKVDKLPNGCWFWTGGRSRGKGNRKWYGSFHLGKRTVRAHRFACDVIGKKSCPRSTPIKRRKPRMKISDVLYQMLHRRVQRSVTEDN